MLKLTETFPTLGAWLYAFPLYFIGIGFQIPRGTPGKVSLCNILRKFFFLVYSVPMNDILLI